MPLLQEHIKPGETVQVVIEAKPGYTFKGTQLPVVSYLWITQIIANDGVTTGFMIKAINPDEPSKPLGTFVRPPRRTRTVDCISGKKVKPAIHQVTRCNLHSFNRSEYAYSRKRRREEKHRIHLASACQLRRWHWIQVSVVFSCFQISSLNRRSHCDTGRQFSRTTWSTGWTSHPSAPCTLEIVLQLRGALRQRVTTNQVWSKT